MSSPNGPALYLSSDVDFGKVAFHGWTRVRTFAAAHTAPRTHSPSAWASSFRILWVFAQPQAPSASSCPFSHFPRSPHGLIWLLERLPSPHYTF